MVCVCMCESHSVVFDSMQPHGLHGPWNSPGQKTGVGCCSLLQIHMRTRAHTHTHTHTHTILSRIVIWHKPTQHCKAIIL